MEGQEEVLRKLDVISVLLIELIDRVSDNEDKIPEGKFMLKLEKLGLETSEIAKLFGKSTAQVSKQLYGLRGKKQ